MGPLRRTVLLWMIGLGLLATVPAPAAAAPPSGSPPMNPTLPSATEGLRQRETLLHQQGVDRPLPVARPSAPVEEPPGPLAVLESFFVGVARHPVLLGGVVGVILLLSLGWFALGQRHAWIRGPAAQPTPALARAMAALQPSPPEKALDLRRARLAVASGRPLLLSLSYEIKAERRPEFLTFTERLRDHLVRELGYAYAVWEQDGKPNWFTEMILCTSVQEFDRLAGPDDSTTRRLVAQLDQFLRDQTKLQRTSLIGVGLAPAAARASGEPVVRQPDAVLQPDPRSVPIPRPARGAPPGDLAAEAA